MKSLIIVLVLMFFILQYKLWIGENGVKRTVHLRHAIVLQTHENETMQHYNDTLEAEVKDLKNGQIAIEERARRELGMIKKNEQYYRIIEK